MVIENNIVLASLILKILNQYRSSDDDQLIEDYGTEIMKFTLNNYSKFTLGVLAWICINLSFWNTEFDTLFGLFQERSEKVTVSGINLQYPIMVHVQKLKRRGGIVDFNMEFQVDVGRTVSRIEKKVDKTYITVASIDDQISIIDSTLQSLYGLSESKLDEIDSKLSILKNQNEELYDFLVRVNILLKSKLTAIRRQQQIESETISEILESIDEIVQTLDEQTKTYWGKVKEWASSLPGALTIELLGATIFQELIWPILSGVL